jgi:hypothetical protein
VTDTHPHLDPDPDSHPSPNLQLAHGSHSTARTVSRLHAVHSSPTPLSHTHYPHSPLACVHAPHSHGMCCAVRGCACSAVRAALCVLQVMNHEHMDGILIQWYQGACENLGHCPHAQCGKSPGASGCFDLNFSVSILKMLSSGAGACLKSGKQNGGT